MGIAVENDTNIYITDGKYRSIIIVTTISGTINFLLQLHKIYAAFSVHFKNDTVVGKSLETCKELLNQSNTFIKGTVDKVKETCNISKQTNDPEGTGLKRTQDSVSMLYHSIIRLSQIIGTIDQQFTPNLESCPTTMLENLNALSYLKHALPTKLQYTVDTLVLFSGKASIGPHVSSHQIHHITLCPHTIFL